MGNTEENRAQHKTLDNTMDFFNDILLIFTFQYEYMSRTHHNEINVKIVMSELLNRH